MPALRIHPLVETEFEAARSWYAERSALAAEHFDTRFDAALERIATRPTANAPWRSFFRRVRLKQFPYLLIFHTSLRLTRVLALVHERREPSTILPHLQRRFATLS